jgi:hypothetical protein
MHATGERTEVPSRRLLAFGHQIADGRLFSARKAKPSEVHVGTSGTARTKSG